MGERLQLKIWYRSELCNLNNMKRMTLLFSSDAISPILPSRFSIIAAAQCISDYSKFAVIESYVQILTYIAINTRLDLTFSNRR